MTVWSTAALVVLLLMCWWSSVSCHDLPHALEDRTQTDPRVLPQTGEAGVGHSPSRRGPQGTPSIHLMPPRTQGGVSSTNNDNEAPRTSQGDGPRRVIWPDGSSPIGTQDGGVGEDKIPHGDGHEPKKPPPRSHEEHGDSHSTEPLGPGPRNPKDGGAGDLPDPNQWPNNPSPKRPEDHGHLPESHGSETRYFRGREDNDHSDHGAEVEEDLCHSLCLCKHDDSVVSCEHEHVEDDHIHELVLYADRLPKKVKTFRVIGFDRLEIHQDTFANPNMTIERITFKGIGRLVLHPGSLYFHEYSNGNTKVEMVFEGCTIPTIPEGAITQNATRHDSETIELGLEDTRYIDLVINRCSIADVARHAIVDTRFINFSINNTKIGRMETGSIDIDVYEKFEMVNTEVPTLIKNGVCIRSDGVVVFSGNVINMIEGLALNVTSDSQVLFEHNQVGELDALALLGIVPPKGARGASIVFLDNQIETAVPESLVIHPRYQTHERKVLSNKFNVPCMCNISEIFGDLLNTSNLEGEVFMAVMDNSLCLNEDLVYMKVKEYLDEECWTLNMFYIIAAGLVLAIILILAVVIVICWQRVKKLKEENSYATEGSTRSFSTLRSCPPLSPGVPGPPSSEGRASPSWIMAIPEIKTYQETEVHMPYDRTETMDSSKLSYSGSPYHSYKSDGRTSSPFH
ncbi:uncharacterized protein LOC143039598 [Oratosquilla oratoria]|uniref:uncharacterized protein LOC143039598 n=1 Tax=Oratosquilla oratoria TaxID=337810 RepID=UPI003F75E435